MPEDLSYDNITALLKFLYECEDPQEVLKNFSREELLELLDAMNQLLNNYYLSPTGRIEFHDE